MHYESSCHTWYVPDLTFLSHLAQRSRHKATRSSVAQIHQGQGHKWKCTLCIAFLIIYSSLPGPVAPSVTEISEERRLIITVAGSSTQEREGRLEWDSACCPTWLIHGSSTHGASDRSTRGSTCSDLTNGAGKWLVTSVMMFVFFSVIWLTPFLSMLSYLSFVYLFYMCLLW